ncbi:hypothetical protein LguiA_007554 [Lonicera macranthoides]
MGQVNERFLTGFDDFTSRLLSLYLSLSLSLSLNLLLSSTSQPQPMGKLVARPKIGA